MAVSGKSVEKMEPEMAGTRKSTGPVTLTGSQKQLFEQLVKKLEESLSKIHTSRDITPEQIKELGAIGAQLHKSLKDSGTPVRHHKYMAENRGLKPDDLHFYDHIHPVQDLIKFIHNQSANDDPEDLTIGHEFEFVVYSRRWNHTDTYTVTRTKSGWTFAYAREPIATGKDGRIRRQFNTGLFELLDHDSINYPEELPGYFECLWERAAQDGLTHEKTQEAITMLADWVSLVEKNSPNGVFESYK